jgi:ribosomal 50S subunit-associated protein YjgA (DUF615 family)
MSTETNWPSDEQTQKAFENVQKTGEEALQLGGKYLRENPIPLILLAAVVGAILGALIRPVPRRDPDTVRAVREWFEKAVQDFIAKVPAAKKQVRRLQEDVIDQAEGLKKKLGSPWH